MPCLHLGPVLGTSVWLTGPGHLCIEAFFSLNPFLGSLAQVMYAQRPQRLEPLL
jgi:hypothetical protein